MIELDKESFSSRYKHFLWFLAPFQAGYINVGAYHIAGGFFVSHVTGTSSMTGVGIARLDPVIFATFVTVLLSFILGAGLSGFFIKYKKEITGHSDYSTVMFVKFLFFGLVLILSELDLFYTSESVIEASHILMLFLLSFCCGVQNSSASLATGGFLKPTHMTGLSTDVGVHLYRFFYRKTQSDRLEFKKTLLRIKILMAFIIGGAFSEIIFSTQGHYGFIFPFLSAFFFLMISLPKSRDIARAKSFYFLKASLTAVFVITLVIGIASYSNYIA